MLMLVHGHIASVQAMLLNDRLRRLGQDFAQQHLADQRLPDKDKRPFTLVIGMRSWLFSAFRAMLRTPA